VEQFSSDKQVEEGLVQQRGRLEVPAADTLANAETHYVVLASLNTPGIGPMRIRRTYPEKDLYLICPPAKEFHCTNLGFVAVVSNQIRAKVRLVVTLKFRDLSTEKATFTHAEIPAFKLWLPVPYY